MTILQLIQSMATTLGVSLDYTAPGLSSLAQVTNDIPDNEVVQLTSANVLTEEAARNNPTLKRHFFAQALSAVDARIEQVITSSGLEQSAADEIRRDTNSYNRIELLANAMSKLKAGTPPAANSEIARLNAELATLKTDHQAELTALKSSHTEATKNFLIENLVRSKKLDTSMFDQSTMSMVAINKLQQALSINKGVVILDGDVLKVVSSEDPTTPLYINNQPVQIGDFLDKVLADNKLLEVSPPSGTPPTVLPTNNPPTGVAGRNNLSTKLAGILQPTQNPGNVTLPPPLPIG